jgi:hypothetical protein
VERDTQPISEAAVKTAMDCDAHSSGTNLAWPVFYRFLAALWVLGWIVVTYRDLTWSLPIMALGPIPFAAIGFGVLRGKTSAYLVAMLTDCTLGALVFGFSVLALHQGAVDWWTTSMLAMASGALAEGLYFLRKAQMEVWPFVLYVILAVVFSAAGYVLASFGGD